MATKPSGKQSVLGATVILVVAASVVGYVVHGKQFVPALQDSVRRITRRVKYGRPGSQFRR